MTIRDGRVDEYIAHTAPFARPVLEHLRDLVHAALPGCEETIKWGMPHFTLAGKNIAGMSAFKAHAAFVIHGDGRQGDAMGQYGRITSLADLPPDRDLTRKLKAVGEAVIGGRTKPRPAAKPREDIPMPADFAAALRGCDGAQAHYDAFAPGYRREYLEWITEAKADATRAKRIAQAAEWIAEGKKRNWKYEKC